MFDSLAVRVVERNVAAWLTSMTSVIYPPSAVRVLYTRKWISETDGEARSLASIRPVSAVNSCGGIFAFIVISLIRRTGIFPRAMDQLVENGRCYSIAERLRNRSRKESHMAGHSIGLFGASCVTRGLGLAIDSYTIR